MTPEEREQQIQEVARRVAERLVEQWPTGRADINAIEDFAERMGQEVQREVTERLLREEAARKTGNQEACACGRLAPYRRHQALTLVTAAGRQRVRRAYYYCAPCGRGFCPADTWLGLGPGHTTPLAQARLAALAAFVPYGQTAALLAQLGVPLSLDLKQTERVAQAVGAQVAAVAAAPYGPATRPVAVGFDGVMLPTWEGRKEARVGVVYEPEWGAPRTPAAEAGLHKEYFATTGSRESLVAAVCARAHARAGGGVVAVVADGAALDWVDLDAHLPQRVEILDFYHVLARVAEIAAAMHAEAAMAATWRAQMQAELLQWGAPTLIAALIGWQPTAAAAQEVRREQLAYFVRQQERMRYPDYLRRGFPIGSGAAEGACKHVVLDRLGASGMRWKPATAEPVLALRAALLTQPHLNLRRVLEQQAVAPSA